MGHRFRVLFPERACLSAEVPSQPAAMSAMTSDLAAARRRVRNGWAACP